MHQSADSPKREVSRPHKPNQTAVKPNGEQTTKNIDSQLFTEKRCSRDEQGQEQWPIDSNVDQKTAMVTNRQQW